MDDGDDFVRSSAARDRGEDDPSPEAVEEGTSPLASRPGATAGLLPAILVLVAALLAWSDAVPVVAELATGVPGGVAGANAGALAAAVAGAVALFAFSAGRWDRLDRSTGSAVAGGASLVALLVGAGAVVAGVTAPEPHVGGGPLLAIGGGIGGVLAAYADREAVTADRLRTVTTRIGIATGVGIGGFLMIVIWQLLFFWTASTLVGDLSEMQLTLVGTLSLGPGAATAAVLYVYGTDRDWSFVDFDTPTFREAGFAVGGLVALIVALYAIQVVFSMAGIEGAEHGIAERAEGNPELLLLLIPASLLIIGPGEELLFRNIVQKSMYDAITRWQAAAVASVVFAVVHVPAYSTGSPDQTMVSVVVIFALSLILGGLYVLTENLVVPAFVHGAFNAFQFAALYYSLTGDSTVGLAVVLLA